MNNLNIFIGYDTREDLAYKVAEKSIKLYNNDIPIFPIIQRQLRDANIYWRSIDLLASTEFTLTRFLTPYLSNYMGWSLFIDCDTLLLADIKELFALRDDNFAIQVVKHDYTPTTDKKMDGATQAIYPRKNWSSVMLFNNEHPANKQLTLNYINTATPSELHRLRWLTDSQIGTLPSSWNWLVGWYSETENFKPKLLHYTEGGPWFDAYKNCSYADRWNYVCNLL